MKNALNIYIYIISDIGGKFMLEVISSEASKGSKKKNMRQNDHWINVN